MFSKVRLREKAHARKFRDGEKKQLLLTSLRVSCGSFLFFAVDRWWRAAIPLRKVFAKPGPPTNALSRSAEICREICLKFQFAPLIIRALYENDIYTLLLLFGFANFRQHKLTTEFIIYYKFLCLLFCSLATSK